IDFSLQLSDVLLEQIRAFFEFAPNAKLSLFASAETMEILHSVDMRVVIANVVRLRQMMLEAHKKAELQFDCAVTRENISRIGGVARLASLLGLDALNVFETADDTLKDLTDGEARRFADSVIGAVMTLNGTATKIAFQPALQKKLEPVISAINDGRSVTAAPFHHLDAMRGGPCLQPWETSIVLRTGGVKLCAGPTEPAGRLADGDLFTIVNSTVARNLRTRMLRGGPGLPCSSCAFATTDRSVTFGQKVAAAHARYDATVPPWQVFLPTGLTYDNEFGITTQARLFLEDLDPEEIGTSIEFANHYIPSPIADLDRLLDAVPLAPESSTLIDLGSGMGRVVFHAAHRPYREVIGVELSPALAKVAAANLKAYHGPRLCGDIRLVCGDALKFAFPAGDLIIYLFNPFQAPVMRPVLERLAAHDGKVVIVYYAPLEAAMLDANPAFVSFADFVLEDRRNVARIWVSRIVQR
ncbi:MAG TPA: methyltransferase domain-containing protein, partial [Candidatus Baltobacteraceae bacterium]|nr:methyltransferase domain-containing protein [Candidatus Baltobacteraceae bacterium]